MALPKLFQRIFWHNNTTPAINEDNLNAMSKGLSDVDDRVISLAETIMEDVPQIQEDIEELEEDFALIDEKIAAATSEANRATTKANEAAASVISAGNKALISEGYAKGTQNGTPVGSSSPYYHNNAEYFKEQARSFTPTGYQDLVDDVAEAQEAITDIEGEKVSSNDAYILRQGKGNMVDFDLVGGSVAWNQLVDKSRFSDSNYLSTLRCTTSISNTKITVTATSSDPAIRFLMGIPVPANHVLLVTADFKPTTATTRSNIIVRENVNPSSPTTIATSSNKAFSANINSKFYFMFKTSTDIAELRIDYYLNGASAVNGDLDNVQLFDFTANFGSSTIADYIYSLEQATAGAGVEWFRQYFPDAYYAYDAGSIQSVNPSSRKVVGKNLVNPSEILEGYYLDGSGQPVATTNAYITGFIPIFKGQPIYIPATGTARRCTYDCGKNFVEYLNVSTAQILTPTFDGYLRVSAQPSTVTKDNIMINYGSTATTYEPYKEYSFPFDSSKQLRGIPKLVNNKLSYDGDIYRADGSVTRKYGVVDLGSLTWVYNTSSGHERFVSTTLSNVKLVATTVVPNAICHKYLVDTSDRIYNHTSDKTIGINNEGGVGIYDTSAGTDATAFKTAMSGVYLVYELATPTTESANPFQNPQSAFSDGIEEFVYNSEIAVPVGNNSVYQTSEIAPLITKYAEGIKTGAIDTIKAVVADSSDFADFQTKMAAL